MRKILLYVALVVCAIGTNAQDMNPDEVAKLKKEMNEIKKSGDYVYAEGLAEYLSDDGDKAVTQAQKQSMDKLHTQIVMIFSKQLHMSPEDVEEIWDVIDDKCQNVEITAGDVTRTFLYIGKEALASLKPDIHLFPNWEKRKKEKELQEQAETEAEDAVVASATQPITVVPEPEKQTTEPVVAEVVEEQKTDSEVKVDEPVAAVVKADTEVKEAEARTHNIAPTQPVEEPKKEEVKPVEEPKEEEAKPVEEPKKKEVKAVEEPKKAEVPVAPVQTVTTTPVVETPVAEPAPVVKVEIPALCKTMLSKKNYAALYKYLETEKVYQKLIFGPESKMARAEKCYIVLIDKKTRDIVTILDKGIADRINFVTGEMDSFANYKIAGGYMAIFVQEL